MSILFLILQDIFKKFFGKFVQHSRHRDKITIAPLSSTSSVTTEPKNNHPTLTWDSWEAVLWKEPEQ